MEPKKKYQFSLNNNIPRNLFPKNHSFSENKKEENIKIDSSTEVRLPKKYLDWSYDNPKNE